MMTSKVASGKEMGVEGFNAKMARRERWEGGADLLDDRGVVIRGEDLVAFAKEVDEVAAGAAAGVEDAHAGLDVAA